MVHLDILFGDIQSYTASCIALMGARLMESFEYMCLLFGRGYRYRRPPLV